MPNKDLTFRLFGEDKTASSALGSLSSKFDGISKSATAAGGKLTLGVTAPLAAVAAGAVRTEADFSRSMAQVAVATGAPRAQLDQLSKYALEMGAKTTFSAGEAAGAMLNLAKGGFTPAQIKGGALAATMNLAAAGGLDLSDAATDVVGSLNTFHISAGNASKVTDALAGAANASSADVSDLALALSQGGAAARATKQSLADTAGMLGLLADNGIRGSDAGTSVKTFLLNLVPSSKSAAKEMRELGLSFADSNGHIDKLPKVAEKLRTAFKGLGDDERIAAEKQMFGNDAFRAAESLYQSGPAKLKKYADAAREHGNAQKMAAAQMSGTAGAIESMRGSLETASLTIGQTIAPTVQRVAKFVTDLANRFTKLPGSMQGVIIGGAALAAAIGPVLLIVGQLASSVSAIVTFVGVMKDLQLVTKIATAVQWLFNTAVSANPIGLIILAVAALIAGIILLVTHWKEVCKFLQDVWGGICKWFGDTLTSVGRWWVDTWNGIRKTAVTILSGVIGFIRDLIEGYVGWWRDRWTDVTGFFGRIWSAQLKAWRTLWSGVIGWIGDLIDGYVGWWRGVWAGIAGFFGDLWVKAIAGFRRVWEGAIAFLSGIPDKILGFFAGADRWLLDAGRHVIEGLVAGVKNTLGLVTGAVRNVASGVIDTFKDVLGIHSPSRVFIELAGWIGKGLVAGLAGTADAVHQAVSDLGSKVVDGFSKMADQRKSAQDKLDQLDDKLKATLKDRPRLVADSEGKVSAARQAAYEKAVRHWRQRVDLLHKERDTEQRTLDSLFTAAQAKSKKSRLAALIADDNKRLSGLAAQRDQLLSQLDDAKGRLADAQQAWQDTFASTSGDAFGTGNVVSSSLGYWQQDATERVGTNSTDRMRSTLQAQIDRTKRFQADLRQLVAMGVDPATYQQIVAGGISGGGLEAADDLIASGAGSIAEFRSLQAQLKAASDGLGVDVANQMHLAGVQSAQGLVDGLLSQVSTVQSAMDTIADAMVKAIKKSLDIKSPSRRFNREVGRMIPAGIVDGVNAGRGDVEKSVTALVNVPRYATAPGSTGLPGQIPAGRDRALVHIDNFHATPEQSPADIAADLGWLARGGL